MLRSTPIVLRLVTFIFKPEMKIKLIGEGVELKNVGKQVIQ